MKKRLRDEECVGSEARVLGAPVVNAKGLKRVKFSEPEPVIKARNEVERMKTGDGGGAHRQHSRLDEEEGGQADADKGAADVGAESAASVAAATLNPVTNLLRVVRRGITVRKRTWKLPRYVCKTPDPVEATQTTTMTAKNVETGDACVNNTGGARTPPPSTSVKPSAANVVETNRTTQQQEQEQQEQEQEEVPTSMEICAALFSRMPNASTLKTLMDRDGDARAAVPIRLQRTSRELVTLLLGDPRLGYAPVGLPPSVIFLSVDYLRHFASAMRPSPLTEKPRRSQFPFTKRATAAAIDDDCDIITVDAFMASVHGCRSSERVMELFVSSPPRRRDDRLINASMKDGLHNERRHGNAAARQTQRQQVAHDNWESPTLGHEPRDSSNPFSRFSANSTPREAATSSSPSAQNLVRVAKSPRQTKATARNMKSPPRDESESALSKRIQWEDIEGVFLDIVPAGADMLQFEKILQL